MQVPQLVTRLRSRGATHAHPGEQTPLSPTAIAILTRRRDDMIRQLKRRFAIGSYFWRLSQELARRFGRKSHYSVESVSKTAEGGGFDMAFIAYAHAMFCRRSDFDDYYGPLQVACTYDGLRRPVARRFFGGATGFDATNILLRADSPKEREYDFTDSAPAD